MNFLNTKRLLAVEATSRFAVPILFRCLLCLTVGWLVSLPSMAQSATRPNILLITADDLGLQVGCYGDTLARTPRLDQLAREGMQCMNAYVTQASCSPSRSSIFTGLYPHQSGQIGLSHRGFAMHDTITTLPAMLKEAGYRTGIIGKLHVQPEKNFPFDFEFLKNGARQTREVRTVADSAAAFISRANDAPFFLMVNYFDPHVQFVPQVEGLPPTPYRPEEVGALPFQQVDTPEQRERIANFYSCIARLDTGVGLLLDALEALGQADNTLVIFVGDHGAPFTRGKTSCYEAGLKVPFLVRWPGRVPEKRSAEVLISTVDIVPTLLETLQLPIPGYLAGRSLTPLFENAPADWRTHLYGEFFYHTHKQYFPRYSVRDERYKLIYNVSDTLTPLLSVDGDSAYWMAQQPALNGTLADSLLSRYAHPPPYELYDLRADPDEYHNLANDPAHRARQAQMQAHLQQWMRQTKAFLPEKRE